MTHCQPANYVCSVDCQKHSSHKEARAVGAILQYRTVTLPGSERGYTCDVISHCVTVCSEHMHSVYTSQKSVRSNRFHVASGLLGCDDASSGQRLPTCAFVRTVGLARVTCVCGGTKISDCKVTVQYHTYQLWPAVCVCVWGGGACVCVCARACVGG